MIRSKKKIHETGNPITRTLSNYEQSTLGHCKHKRKKNKLPNKVIMKMLTKLPRIVVTPENSDEHDQVSFNNF